ncbi:MAG: response regulator, partial [Bradyrhizobium sp.]
TETEPSARDIAAIIGQIKAARIPAVFLENISDDRLIRRIAAETGAKVEPPATAVRTTSGAAKEAAPAAEAKPRTDLTGQGTILLVEDEEGLRALNARGLRSRGYTVVEAENGVEAMEMLEEQGGAIDLVVSDVVMPEMDGPTLLKAMRATNPDIKFIFVSGYAEDAFEKSLPEGQQFDFLPKPFTLSQLVAAVKETMTKQG